MCLFPYVLRYDAFLRGTSNVEVPCGKCVECLKDRQNSWKLRLTEEARNWSTLCFFTLTYSECSVPRNDFGNTTASLDDIQRWIKRWRISLVRRYGKDSALSDIKFFICAEYAPDGYYLHRKTRTMRRSTMRPHYHGVIFSNLDADFVKDTLIRDWRSRYGFVKFDKVRCRREDRSSVMNYISKYCCKGCFASRLAEIARGEIEKAFTVMSKGIGLSYVLRNKAYHLCGFTLRQYRVFTPEQIKSICLRRYVKDGEYQYKMPRYWKDRIYRNLSTKEQKIWNKELKQFVVHYVKRYTSENVLSLQMSDFLRDRFLERVRLSLPPGDFEQYGLENEIDWYGCSPRSLAVKEARIARKLSSFYKSNAIKNSALSFC